MPPERRSVREKRPSERATQQPPPRLRRATPSRPYPSPARALATPPPSQARPPPVEVVEGPEERLDRARRMELIAAKVLSRGFEEAEELASDSASVLDTPPPPAVYTLTYRAFFGSLETFTQVQSPQAISNSVSYDAAFEWVSRECELEAQSGGIKWALVSKQAQTVAYYQNLVQRSHLKQSARSNDELAIVTSWLEGWSHSHTGLAVDVVWKLEKVKEVPIPQPSVPPGGLIRRTVTSQQRAAIPAVLEDEESAGNIGPRLTMR